MDYKITNIDAETKKIEATFTYKEKTLAHSFFVENVTKDEILQGVEQHYTEFKDAIERSENKPQLPDDVASLITKSE